ncbi:putative glycosyltransferase EpsD [Rubripirellula tenax]|uniref:Putative glycosyltransferase EpsD n=1 Tax=Rubripirellula tenax TaxID=2528015 RepID=A0A5C6EZA3_9BACT|nr:glycosyltransferase [Rubripirellula tenax]TWU54488.1 putative glycosyltransferase EpsD [Rubripirellula tenax]
MSISYQQLSKHISIDTQVGPVKYLHIFPEYNRGGAEIRVSRTINAMGPGHGHAVLSISGRTDAADVLDPSCNVRVFQGPPKKGPIRFPIDLWKCVRDINPSVVLTYNWGATDAVLAAKIARFRPVIHNECGLSADLDGKGWRRQLARRVLLPGCYRVVVTSFTLYDLAIRKFGVPKNKIAFIKTGVNTERFSPGMNDELREKITHGDCRSVVFGYVGSLRPSKNVPMLLRAFAAAKPSMECPAVLALFGDGPERERLTDLARDLGILESLYFHGYIDNPECAFNAIDVNVTASMSEAASNSLLEAMASGLPVVSTDIADNKRMLSDENRPFVYAHDDHAGYTSALKTLANDLQMRNHLGEANRSHVCQEYPVDRMYREYANLWSQAAEFAMTRPGR